MTGVALMAAMVILGVLAALLFPLDLFRRRACLQKPTERVDERDTMFARMARQSGTEQYDDYYSSRTAFKERDDQIRRMPRLMDPGGIHFHDAVMQEARAYFDDIEHIAVDRSLVARLARRLKGAQSPNAAVRESVLDLGGVAVGFTTLGKEYVYSVKGRFDWNYGDRITLDHPYAIVFLVEMDFDEMQYAPQAETLRESARQYYLAAYIAKTLEAALLASGADAKAHYDAHYDLILPPLAVMAGLGEVGRNNILVAGRFGSRVRIGAVTTKLQLEPSRQRSLGVDAFCRICKKCAENCPSRALCTGEKIDCLGVSKWPTNVEQCYSYWRSAGTDCGICMAVCPFSHRNNRFHNTVRFLVRLNPLIRHVALFLEDAIYGRKWKPHARFSAATRKPRIGKEQVSGDGLGGS